MIKRPSPDESADYYQPYIAELPPEGILAVLISQKTETLSLFESLSEAQGQLRYAAGKWSMKEVLGHLVDTELLFCCRAMCFARGDSGPLPSMDENAYVASAAFDLRSLANLAQQYSGQRQATISFFSSLDETALLRRGVASGCTFTVRAIVHIIGGHERHHLNILKERYLGQ